MEDNAFKTLLNTFIHISKHQPTIIYSKQLADLYSVSLSQFCQLNCKTIIILSWLTIRFFFIWPVLSHLPKPLKTTSSACSVLSKAKVANNPLIYRSSQSRKKWVKAKVTSYHITQEGALQRSTVITQTDPSSTTLSKGSDEGQVIWAQSSTNVAHAPSSRPQPIVDRCPNSATATLSFQESQG